MDPSRLTLGYFLCHDPRNGDHHGCLLGLCNVEFWRVLELGPGGTRGVCPVAHLGRGYSHHDHLYDKQHGAQNIDRPDYLLLDLGVLCDLLAEKRRLSRWFGALLSRPWPVQPALVHALRLEL